jgi:hypothetical protein
MKIRARSTVIAAAVVATALWENAAHSQQPAAGAESRVPITFTGGHETDPQDRGRPVVLVAAALGVPGEVFRAAFRGVTPAPAGQRPEGGRVRHNKEVLLRALGPYGVTNERLDAVSDYYRYQPGRGELWPTSSAAGYATVRNGVVTGFTITYPGSGYSSPPAAFVSGRPGVQGRVTLSFSTDVRKNGAVTAITLDDGAASPREPGRGRGARR